jgi:two-component system invasion response regulator UvrY
VIKVLIADDHPIVRRGLRDILEEEPDIQVIAEAGDGRQALERIERDDPDVVVLDLNMPPPGGLEVLERLRRARSSTPVLVLSVHPEEQYAVRALKSGAAGYLSKDAAPTELVNAVRRVHGGGRYVSPAVAERLALAVTGDVRPIPHEALSAREFQVLRMIGSGMTVSEIGRELCLSAKTVSTYRARILEKMQLQTTADLIRYVVEQELAP